MNKIKILLLFSFVSINLSSCLLLYGIRTRPYDQSAIDNFLSEFDYDHSIVLKDSTYSRFYYSLYSCKDSSLAQNFFQPLQVHYLDSDMNLLSSKVNCYAKSSITHLKWDLNTHFPPSSDFDAEICDQVIKNLIVPYPIQDKEYYVVVFWNLYMKKQAQHLIEEVQKSIKREKLSLILVNNDVWMQE